jgi:formylglycine-generating enzyme required for sulfatase activity
MTTELHPVQCGRCGRTVVVAVSDLHPLCFHHLEEQAECPEIKERKGADGGIGGTFLTMCRALEQSIRPMLEGAKVEAIVHEGVWQVACRTGKAKPAYYPPTQARRQAELWDGRGYKSLAERLRAAADQAEQQPPSSAGTVRRRKRGPVVVMALAASVIAIVVVGGAFWSFLMRQSDPMVVETDARDAGAMPNVPADAVSADPSTTAALLPQADTTTQAAAAPPSPGAPLTAFNAPIRPTLSPSVRDADAAEEPEMVALPGGTYAMGSKDDSSELPVHRVAIKPFAISKFPITIREWNVCVAARACSYEPTGEDDAPVTNLSWNDAQQFTAWLARTTQKAYRLPSEAEWEYAARAGTGTKYWWGDRLRAGMADCQGCNGDADAGNVVKVGSFPANPFGLHDMGGAVAQWVADCWHKNYQGAPADGVPWIDGDCNSRVIRSGSSKNDPRYVRSASRDYYDGRFRYPTHGFRVAYSL